MYVTLLPVYHINRRNPLHICKGLHIERSYNFVCYNEIKFRRFNSLYNVGFEIPVFSSTLLYVCVSFNLIACSICCLLNFLGLPSLKLGSCRAIILPSCVRSTIISRSNSANDIIILNIKRPVGVFSITPMFKTCTRTPNSNKSFITSIPLRTLLANLSSLVTTKVSPACNCSSSLLNSCLSVLTPVNFSLYSISHPSLLSTATCACKSCPIVETLAYPYFNRHSPFHI